MRKQVLDTLFNTLHKDIPDEMLFNFMYDAYRKKAAERTFWDNPTLEAWKEERKRLKEIFLEMFSPFPESTSLNERITAEYVRDGYRMLCVCFDSAPNVTITANLYIPNGAEAGKTPAVVLACGHSNDAKSYYRYAAESLVKNGILTLCFDPTAQGERFNCWNYARWQPRILFEHDRLGVLSMLMGGNISGNFAWDCMRAVDYLISRPETDPEKIGFMGTSGGGTQTTWAAALDDRVSVAVPCCFITSIDELLLSREPSDSEQNPPGLLAHGLEYRDFLGMMAPKPVLVLGAEEDFFPVAGAVDTVNSLKKLYACYGMEDRVELHRFPGGHAGRGAMATKGCQWFCRWFGLPVPEFPEGETARIEIALKNEPNVDEDTFVVGGQIIYGRENSNYWPYYQKCFRELKTGPVDLEALRHTLRIVLPDAPVEVTRKIDGPVQGGFLNSEDGITIPWLYAMAGDKPSGKLCILSHEDGMTCMFANGREGELLLQAGVDVLAFDPRGIGTTQGGAFGWWADTARAYLAPLNEGALPYWGLGMVDPPHEGYCATNHELGMHGFKLDRPLLGQRTADAMRVLSAIHEITGTTYEQHLIYGSGYSAAWMLYAALLTEVPIHRCAFHSLLASFKLLAELPENRYMVEQIARGLLLTGDFPNALNALKCDCLLIDPVNAMRFPIEKLLGEAVLKDTCVERCYTEGASNPLYEMVDYITR